MSVCPSLSPQLHGRRHASHPLVPGRGVPVRNGYRRLGEDSAEGCCLFSRWIHRAIRRGQRGAQGFEGCFRLRDNRLRDGGLGRSLFHRREGGPLHRRSRAVGRPRRGPRRHGAPGHAKGSDRVRALALPRTLALIRLRKTARARKPAGKEQQLAYRLLHPLSNFETCPTCSVLACVAFGAALTATDAARPTMKRPSGKLKILGKLADNFFHTTKAYRRATHVPPPSLPPPTLTRRRRVAQGAAQQPQAQGARHTAA